MKRLTIDWTLCNGHGVCAAAFGERIASDAMGYPHMPTEMEVTPEQEGAARAAVANCPGAALRLRSA